MTFLASLQGFASTPFITFFANFTPGDMFAYTMISEMSNMLKTTTMMITVYLGSSGELLGYSNRVGDLCRQLTRFMKEEKNKKDDVEMDSFDIRDVPLSTPEGRQLQKYPLSFQVQPGSDGLVIIGKSGCGKSTLLRIMAGLLKVE